MILFYVITAALIASLLCLPVTWALRKWNVLDRPNNRSSHDKPIIRGGGIAVLAAFFIVGSLVAYRNWDYRVGFVASTGFVLAVVSFVDDIKSISAIIRLSVQFGAAIVAVLAVCSQRTGGTAIFEIAAFYSIGVIWITGYINAFNFMDGINGIAIMQAVTSGIGTGLVGFMAGARMTNPAIILPFVLAGASFGFLPYNFPKARMFLGDIGSVAIGYFLAVFAFWLARDFGWWLLGAFGLLHANFVLDSGITLARRIRNGELWYDAHREHYYQRLVRAGSSHGFVTSLECLIQMFVVASVTVAVKCGWAVRVGVALLVLFTWMLFFIYSDRAFRRSQLKGVTRNIEDHLF